MQKRCRRSPWILYQSMMMEEYRRELMVVYCSSTEGCRREACRNIAIDSSCAMNSVVVVEEVVTISSSATGDAAVCVPCSSREGQTSRPAISATSQMVDLAGVGDALANVPM